MEDFFDKIDSQLQNKPSKEKLLLEKEYNVFIIGYQQSGKSTLANVLSDQQQLHFQKEGNNQFIPINDHYFPIAKENGIGTQKPNSIVKSEFQIWDFPGYGMEEDSIEIRIQQIVMMNKSPKIHIIIVLPYTQFTQDRGQNLIQLLNLVSQKDLPASIIVSKVPPKGKLNTVIEKLETQLSSDEIIYTDEAKDVLSQMITNNRIQIFNYPQMIEEVQNKQSIQIQQFNPENIKQIQQLVLEKKYFDKLQISFKFLSSQEIKIKEYSLMVQQKLKEINETIIQNSIKIKLSGIKRSVPDQQFFQDKKEYDELIRQKQQYQNYFQLIQQIFQIESIDDIIDSQIKKINELFTKIDHKVIQDMLHINCMSLSLSELQKIYEQKNQNIKEIYVLSLHQFIVDCDIKIPGVHLYIKCKQFRVNIKSLIDLKGQTGQPQSKARDGDETNVNGDIGQNGIQGRPGGSFYIDSEENFFTENLTIDISGGDGGNGQDGGDGYDGKKGEDGEQTDVIEKKESCYEYYEKVEESVWKNLYQLNTQFNVNYRSKGKEGTKGGDAGCGGKGGSVGQKGKVIFKQHCQVKIIDNNCNPGQEGKDGQPGQGGQYGTDYIGQFQVVKAYGVFKDGNLDNTSEKEQTKDCVAGGVLGAAWVGAGVLLSIVAAPIAGGLILGAGLHGIFSGVGKVLREGWNYERKDEENLQYADPGIIRQSMTQNQISTNDHTEIEQNKNRNYFNTTIKQWMIDICDQLKSLNFTDQLIENIIQGMKE